MDAILILPILLIGWVAGVVINGLADSLPVDRKPSAPRCPHCTAPRSVEAWSALMSCAAGEWGCPYCGSTRGFRSIAVELAGIFTPIAIYFWASNSLEFVTGSIVCCIMLLIIVIDLEHRLILHVVTFPAMLITLILNSFNPGIGYKRALLGALTGFLFFFVLYILGGLFSSFIARRRGEELTEVAFGFGDVTLATLIGVIVGFPDVIEALLRGILLAGLFSIFYLLVLAVRRKYSAFEAIPYGPFLVLGCLYVYFVGSTMLQRLVSP